MSFDLEIRFDRGKSTSILWSQGHVSIDIDILRYHRDFIHGRDAYHRDIRFYLKLGRIIRAADRMTQHARLSASIQKCNRRKNDCTSRDTRCTESPESRSPRGGTRSCHGKFMDTMWSRRFRGARQKKYRFAKFLIYPRTSDKQIRPCTISINPHADVFSARRWPSVRPLWLHR